jgi:hypothetical protein
MDKVKIHISRDHGIEDNLVIKFIEATKENEFKTKTIKIEMKRIIEVEFFKNFLGSYVKELEQ